MGFSRLGSDTLYSFDALISSEEGRKEDDYRIQKLIFLFKLIVESIWNFEVNNRICLPFTQYNILLVNRRERGSRI